MYKVPEECGDTLEFDQEYVEALKRRAVRREMTNDFTRGLEDITAASMLEGFQNDETMLVADRILKKLSRQQAKEAMQKREPLLPPSAQFVETYFSSFCEDPIVDSLEDEEEEEDEEDDEDSSGGATASSGDGNRTGFSKAKRALVLNEYDQVIPACTEEIECDSGEKHAALVLRGTFHLMMGKIALAKKDFDAVISTEDVDRKLKVNALIKRATVYVQLHDPDKSMQDFKSALELDPNNADIFCHRGQAHLQMERVKEALEDFRTCVALNGDFPIAFVQKCYAEYRYVNRSQDVEEKMRGVIREFESALEKFPDCIECYSLFAQVLCERREYERADALFRQAVEIDPDNPALHVHRGLLLLEWTEDEEKAIECIVDALKIDPQCEFAFETYGTIEIQRGNLRHAVELFDRALALAKSEGELAHLLALRNAAMAQAKMSVRLGFRLTSSSSPSSTSPSPSSSTSKAPPRN